MVGLSPIKDALEITARKGLDVKNNICEFQLKNAFKRYVDSENRIVFDEDDAFNVFVKRIKDASEIGTEWWTNDTLVGTYYLKEKTHQSTLNRNRISIKSVDRAYIIFNKVFANQYGAGANEYFTAPGIFRDVIRTNTFRDSRKYTFAGTDGAEDIFFDINARFVSEGGKIQDFRDTPTTTLSSGITSSDTTITVASTAGFQDEGTLVIGHEHIYYAGRTSTTFTGCVRAIDRTVAVSHSSSTTVYQGFPILLFSKVWKPIYEWLSELGQPLNTNYPQEQVPGNELFYTRSFLLWLDKDNEVHFVPTSDDVDRTLVVGENQIYELSLEKTVFEAVNMVIYNVGQDMYGAGVNWYWYDQNTQTNDLKMRYQPMINIMEDLLNDWKLFAERYSIALAEGDQSNTLRRFPSSFPLSDWSFKYDSNQWRLSQGDSPRATLANESDFNASLREAALFRGRAQAQDITSRVGGLRYRGTITLRGDYYNPGDLISVTNQETGLQTQLIRVIDVTHNIGKNQWSTTLSVSEDEEALRRQD